MEKNMPLSDFLPFGIVFTDDNFKINSCNDFMKMEFFNNKQNVINQFVKDELEDFFYDEKNLEEIIIREYTYKGKKYVIQMYPPDNHEMKGYIFCIFNEGKYEINTNGVDSYKNLKIDLQAIFETSYDVIYVADGAGNTLRVSQACEALWGIKQDEFVGKNIYDLEKEGIFTPSIVRLVLESGEKVTSMQKTKTGKRLMVSGIPIKDESGNIIRVINASRDITEINQLQDELDSSNKKIEEYKAELNKLKAEEQEKNKIVYRSPLMRSVVSLAKKVAEVNSTILILGETGVGKKAMASFIHSQSVRKDKAFISVNCGSLSENLTQEMNLESSKGLQSGIPKKLENLFKLANGGTLFLDEINELSLTTQLELHRILSSGKKDVRVIVSASKDLYEDVLNLRFRKDLFYLINVVPITIPSLRRREEDILPLSLKFIEQFNKEYGLNKRFGHGIMEIFMSYDWPGNVTELKNIIERLMVTSDGAVIERDKLPSYLLKSKEFQKGIKVRKILPLKDAIEALEKDLLALALQEYTSTTKIAEVLQVNQSTVSRKITKYFKNS